MSRRPFIPTSYHFAPPPPTPTPATTTTTSPDPGPTYLIFFITGNPGLIAYYETFLSHLHALLTQSTTSPSTSSSPSPSSSRASNNPLKNARIHIAGRSLGGFEISSNSNSSSRSGSSSNGKSTGSNTDAPPPPGSKKKNAQSNLDRLASIPWTQADVLGVGPPYSLKQQIDGVEKVVWRCVGYLAEEMKGGGGGGGKGAKADVRIILIGHSVGSYILLEIVKRHRERLLREKRGADGDDGQQQQQQQAAVVVGGIGLFPTVVDIALSHSGRRLGFLMRLPLVALMASLLVKLITLLIPRQILAVLMAAFMKFPNDAANTTAAFAKSEHGIRQALHMGRDEMETITVDKWDSEIWGAAHESQSGYPRPKLQFLFGQNDHWVADETRDELIRARAGNADEGWKPKMDVDEVENWPHGFCIRHSIPVAERVKEYIEKMIIDDLKNDRR